MIAWKCDVVNQSTLKNIIPQEEAASIQQKRMHAKLPRFNDAMINKKVYTATMIFPMLQ